MVAPRVALTADSWSVTEVFAARPRRAGATDCLCSAYLQAESQWVFVSRLTRKPAKGLAPPNLLITKQRILPANECLYLPE
jgi:hypothetical protein